LRDSPAKRATPTPPVRGRLRRRCRLCFREHRSPASWRSRAKRRASACSRFRRDPQCGAMERQPPQVPQRFRILYAPPQSSSNAGRLESRALAGLFRSGLLPPLFPPPSRRQRLTDAGELDHLRQARPHFPAHCPFAIGQPPIRSRSVPAPLTHRTLARRSAIQTSTDRNMSRGTTSGATLSRARRASSRNCWRNSSDGRAGSTPWRSKSPPSSASS
jgi:hypothetical protein